MNDLTTGFASVRWPWVVEASLALSCFYFVLHRRRGLTKTGLLIDLCVTVALATMWMLYLVRSHATAGAKELVLAFCFAYLAESAITLFLKRHKPVEKIFTSVEAP
jgi:hypothetical protein